MKRGGNQTRRRRVVVGVLTVAASAGACARPAAAATPPATVVPAPSSGLGYAYPEIHSAGLLANIPSGVTVRPDGSLTPMYAVADITPAAGTFVLKGSAVTLVFEHGHPGRHPARSGAPRRSAAGTRRIAARVRTGTPSLVGSPLPQAIAQAKRDKLKLTIALGALKNADGPTLFSNYRVATERTRGKHVLLTTQQAPSRIGTPVTGSAPACPLPSQYTVITDDGAAVLAKTAAPASQYVACARAANRLAVLGFNGKTAAGTSFITSALLAGTYVIAASGQGTTEPHFTASCTGGVYRYDLTSTADDASPLLTTAPSDPLCGGDGAETVEALSPTGFAAWVTKSSTSAYTLSVFDDAGERTVDSGPGVGTPPASPFAAIAIDGDTLSWTNAGMAKTAPLS